MTHWGGGLYISAWTEGKQFTTVNLNWNVYRDNRAGNGGGGMFCDDGATCNSYHEVYDRNCGGNILLDGGTDPNGPNIAQFYHLTNVGALAVGCKGPGDGVRIDRVGGEPAADAYSFINAIFWGNAPGLDFAATCDRECDKVRVNVSHSMVQTKYLEQGLKITFGDGIMAPVDPLFADPANGDFHLKSTGRPLDADGPRAGHRSSSPAIGQGLSGARRPTIPRAPATADRARRLRQQRRGVIRAARRLTPPAGASAGPLRRAPLRQRASRDAPPGVLHPAPPTRRPPRRNA